MTETRYRLRPMDEVAAREIASWRYDPPYDLYDMRGDVDELVRFFCNTLFDYHAVYEEGEEGAEGAEELLVGFCCFGVDAQVPGGDYMEPAMDVGVGMRPALTGAGRGHGFVGAVLAYGIARRAPTRLRVTIAAFNERSQQTFRGHGFAPTQRMFSATNPSREYLIMTRKA